MAKDFCFRAKVPWLGFVDTFAHTCRCGYNGQCALHVYTIHCLAH